MGEVIPLRRREAAKSDTAIALADFAKKEAAGEMEATILIGISKGVTEFHVLDGFADRMQLGVLALVKCLGIVTDKIVATGTAGSTRSGPVSASWEGPPKRRLPRRLIESTKLGDLE